MHPLLIKSLPRPQDPPDETKRKIKDMRNQRKAENGGRGAAESSSRVLRLLAFNESMADGVALVLVHLEFTIIVKHRLELRARQAPKTLRTGLLLLQPQPHPHPPQRRLRRRPLPPGPGPVPGALAAAAVAAAAALSIVYLVEELNHDGPLLQARLLDCLVQLLDEVLPLRHPLELKL